MLLVTPEYIKYCQLISSENSQLEFLEGMSYGEKLFTLKHSFSKTERQAAMEEAKVIAEENHGNLLVLIVEDKTTYKIWEENQKVKIKSQQNQDIDINKINLRKLVNKMRNEGGVSIEDRRYRLKIYQKCFVGSEAVSWLMTALKLSHKNSILLGDRLVEEKWIHHVTDDHYFKDEKLFYRFYEDEQIEAQEEERLVDKHLEKLLNPTKTKIKKLLPAIKGIGNKE